MLYLSTMLYKVLFCILIVDKYIVVIVYDVYTCCVYVMACICYIGPYVYIGHYILCADLFMYSFADIL